MVRNRKILLSGLLLGFFLIISESKANNQFIYAGGEAIFASTQFNWKNVNSSQNIVDGATQTLQPGIFIGYGVLVDNIYIGAEAGAQFGRRHAENEDNQVSMDEIYVVDVRPGYRFWNGNNLIYGILGLNTANFRAKVFNDDDEEDNELCDSGPMRRNGLRFGLGYNLGLGKHVMGRIEYVFTKFFENQFNDTFDNEQTFTWQLNPYSNEISVGLALVFNV